MNEFIQRILERPLSQRIFILVGSLLFMVGFEWMYFYSPTHADIAKHEESVQDLQVKIANEKRLAMNLAKFRAEVKDLDIRLKVALQELPDKREIPDLLTSISNLARDAGLEVPLFKPKPEIIRDFYAEVPVEIVVGGAYHQVATFFDEVGQLSRIVNINQVDIHEPKIDNQQVSLKVACVATTFRYLEESERVVQTSSQEKKRRRKDTKE